jgi:hypothetical protein
MSSVDGYIKQRGIWVPSSVANDEDERALEALAKLNKPETEIDWRAWENNGMMVANMDAIRALGLEDE